MEQKCLKCGETLFKKFLENEIYSRWTIDPSTPIQLQHDGADQYIECSKCRVKNVVVSAPDKGGVPQLQISHYKE